MGILMLIFEWSGRKGVGYSVYPTVTNYLPTKRPDRVCEGPNRGYCISRPHTSKRFEYNATLSVCCLWGTLNNPKINNGLRLLISPVRDSVVLDG